MRLILHAGTHKTGTTSIQHYLSDNRERMLEKGLLYITDSTTLGGAWKVWRSHNWWAHAVTGAYKNEGIEQARTTIEKNRSMAKETDTVVLSSEDLSACSLGDVLWHGVDASDYRAKQTAYLETVRGLLEGFDVEVVLVYRRADEYAESLYQTLIKSSRYAGTFEDFLRVYAPLFDFKEQIAQFERVFPKVTVVSYTSLMPNVVEGFMQVIGFPEKDEDDYRRNTSIDARLIYWKALQDREHGQTSETRKIRRQFIKSKQATALFSDVGKASFWRSAEDRIAFHDKAAEGLDSTLFPGVTSKSGPDGRLDASEVARVTQCYEAWMKKRNRKGLLKLFDKLTGAYEKP